MDTDEEYARRLQAEYDEEMKTANEQERQDAVLAQTLASQAHELSDSEDEITVVSTSSNVKNSHSERYDVEDDDTKDTNDDSIRTEMTRKESHSRKAHTISDDEDCVEDTKHEEEVVQHVPSQGSKSIVPSQGSKSIVPSQGSKSSVPSQGSKSSVPSQGSKSSVPSQVSQSSVPSQASQSSNNVLKKQDSASKKRPLCKFGSECYRKNPWHLEEFYHPHLEANATTSKTAGESAEVEPSAKRQKSSSGERSSSHSANMGKRPFTARLSASAPFNLFLNKTYSVKETHDDPLGLVLPDILNPKLGEIVESAQLNFMVDLKFLMDNYKACQADGKPLLVMYGAMEGDPKDYKRVTCTKVNLPFQYGTHHTKMMLLQYANGLRVVIHTANLVPDDWEEKTQGYWVSPVFPELEGDKSSLVDGESPTRFKRDLVEYLLSYKAPDLTRWSHILRKYDFSSCNMVFVGSSPGYHVGEHKDKWGHMKVRRTLRQHSSPWKSSLPIIAQCSSIGSLGKDAKTWLSGELGLSLTGARGMCANPPTMKVVYPTETDIRNSSQGWMGGSCLPYNSSTHAKQEWLLQHFHCWRSEKRRRTHAMPHIKTYTRLDKEGSKAQFLLLTSANLSKAAWGTLQKQDSQLFIRSYEAGILALPKFVNGAEEFELKSPWKELGFSLPYDIPLTPYSSEDKPWFMNTKKTETDVFGNTYL